jgi:hypothetical protein
MLSFNIRTVCVTRDIFCGIFKLPVAASGKLMWLAVSSMSEGKQLQKMARKVMATAG